MGPYQHVVDLVPDASFIGVPYLKMVLWVLESSAGNHKAIRQCEIYQALVISAPRA